MRSRRFWFVVLGLATIRFFMWLTDSGDFWLTLAFCFILIQEARLTLIEQIIDDITEEEDDDDDDDEDDDDDDTDSKTGGPPTMRITVENPESEYTKQEVP
jgi:hypothetical protein